jgi:predicted acyl esterase
MYKKVYLVIFLIFLLLGNNMLIFQSESEEASSSSRAFTKSTVMLPMRDGVKLATDIYVPNPQGAPQGTILARTPYNKNFTFMGGWTNYGWSAVAQDMRGRWQSEGIDTVFRNAHTDGPDTIAWIAQQNWSNGKIATSGGSALGINQYYIAGANPPNLTCQFIKVATPDMYKHGMYQGGQFRKNMIERWLANQGSTYILPEIWAHENYTMAYWTNVSLEDNWQDVNVPAIHMGGWFDCFAQGTVDGFSGYQYKGGSGAKGKSKLIMGPWTHGGSGRQQQGELTFPANSVNTISSGMFMDMIEQYNEDGPADFDSWPAVHYYVMGDVDNASAPGNVWRTSDVWPPPSNVTAFYFHEGEELGARAPAKNSSRGDFLQGCTTIFTRYRRREIALSWHRGGNHRAG